MESSKILLRRILDICAYRQKILASNIANVDTPNYKARDIDFKEELKRAVEDKNWTKSYKVIEAPTTMPNRDGNTVNLEVEMTKLTETMLTHNAAIQLLNRIGALYKDILRGGR